MKKLITFFLLLTVIFSCKNEEERPYCKQNPDERGVKTINYYLNDSIRVDYNRQVKNFPTIDKDSVYRFHGMSGWATFDFLCSVYNSDDGYLLELAHEDLSSFGKDKSVIKTTAPITRDLWNDFVHTIDTSGFWCQEYDMFKQRFGITSVDSDIFFTIAKQKDSMRVVKWQSPPRDMYKHPDYEGYKQAVDAYIMLISKGLRAGNYPLGKGTVMYKKYRDSIEVKADIWPFSYYLLKDVDIIFNGKSIEKGGAGAMKIHKSDIDTLKHIQFIEEYHDGTTRIFYPHEIKESTSEHF